MNTACMRITTSYNNYNVLVITLHVLYKHLETHRSSTVCKMTNATITSACDSYCIHYAHR